MRINAPSYQTPRFQGMTITNGCFPGDYHFRMLHDGHEWDGRKVVKEGDVKMTLSYPKGFPQLDGKRTLEWHSPRLQDIAEYWKESGIQPLASEILRAMAFAVLESGLPEGLQDYLIEKLQRVSQVELEEGTKAAHFGSYPTLTKYVANPANKAAHTMLHPMELLLYAAGKPDED